MFTNLDPGTDEITNSESAQKSGMNRIHVPNDPCLRCKPVCIIILMAACEMPHRKNRPREAPYKVSPAKIQIFALKGGNFSVQKVENVIRVVTCP